MDGLLQTVLQNLLFKEAEGLSALLLCQSGSTDEEVPVFIKCTQCDNKDLESTLCKMGFYLLPKRKQWS